MSKQTEEETEEEKGRPKCSRVIPKKGKRVKSHGQNGCLFFYESNSDKHTAAY